MDYRLRFAIELESGGLHICLIGKHSRSYTICQRRLLTSSYLVDYLLASDSLLALMTVNCAPSYHNPQPVSSRRCR